MKFPILSRIVVWAVLTLSYLIGLPSFAQTTDVSALIARMDKLHRAGANAEAIPLAEQVRSIYEMKYGPDHPKLASILNNLALLYKEEGRYGDAEPLYRRSVAIYERAYGQRHRSTAIALNNLAELYGDYERFAEAELIFKQLLAMRKARSAPAIRTWRTR
jgi:tetratricopeptide (TPR) repeat protein